jgi:uncharacterized membrane protein YgdD (TMEM256/DUF423 family)
MAVTKSVSLIAAAISGIIAIAAGTAVAHLLGQDPRAAALLATGAQYAMYHALALLGVAALSARHEGERAPFLGAAAWLFLAGTVLFSGSLYLLALTGIAALARVTPFGGVAFLLGWAALGLHGWRARGRG